MSKVYVIMRGFSDSNTHESDLKPVLVCTSKFKAAELKKDLDSSSIGCWYSIIEVDML